MRSTRLRSSWLRHWPRQPQLLPISVAGNDLNENRTFNQYGELDGWTVIVGGQAAATYALTRDADGRLPVAMTAGGTCAGAPQMR